MECAPRCSAHNQRKNYFYFAFVALCGALQTHFHGRGSAVFLCVGNLLVHGAEQSSNIGRVRFDGCGFGGLVEKRHITFSGVFFQFPAKHHLPHHGLSVALCFPERLTGQAVRAVFLLDVLDGQPLDVGIVFKARPERLIQRVKIGAFHLGIKLGVAGVAVAAGGEQRQCHDTGQKNSRKTL